MKKNKAAEPDADNLMALDNVTEFEDVKLRHDLNRSIFVVKKEIRCK